MKCLRSFLKVLPPLVSAVSVVLSLVCSGCVLFRSLDSYSNIVMWLWLIRRDNFYSSSVILQVLISSSKPIYHNRSVSILASMHNSCSCQSIFVFKLPSYQVFIRRVHLVVRMLEWSFSECRSSLGDVRVVRVQVFLLVCRSGHVSHSRRRILRCLQVIRFFVV
jgi:hypothetical protein